MNTNQQFSVSVHILTILAAYPNTPLTSESIAGSVDTHPVVIRRVMGHLRARGLVDSRPGACGGWRLLRAPEQIPLSEVYQAIRHEDILAMHNHPNPNCPIGGKIQSALRPVFGEAQSALEAALGTFTVADVLGRVMSDE